LRKKNLRTITIDDRRRFTEIVSWRPSIDLEVTFANNSAIIGPGAVPTLVTLGRALGRPEVRSGRIIEPDRFVGVVDRVTVIAPEEGGDATDYAGVRIFRIEPEHASARGDDFVAACLHM
jgi:hypothetical protein